MPNCSHCSQAFQIADTDLEFYREMDVPSPILCYLCRMQRRLSNRSERFLYHRKCDLTGKQVISTYSTDKPFPVYDTDVWWSDNWSALDYSRPYDFNRPFFDQFYELRMSVPRLARIQQKPMINSDYCNCASRNQNCYLVFSTNECEDCYYGSWVNQSRDCIDNLTIEHCELCYECVSCNSCYNLRYSQDCSNCKDSAFLQHCIGCSNCFGCTNQINQEYRIFNQQKTKEKYEAFMANVQTGSHHEMEQAKARIQGILNDLIVKEFHGTNLENCLGDYLKDCRNAKLCFECHGCEDVAYSQCIQNSKNCMDHSYWGQNAEWIYECQACGYDLNNLRFCNLCWSGCSNLTYCDHTFSSQHCFGCVGLKKQQYCILNTKYTKEEYEELVPRIIEQMKSTPYTGVIPSSTRDNAMVRRAHHDICEWGQFFPIHHSIYAYNETLAQEQVPLTKEEVLALGWQWKDEEESTEQYMGPAYSIPDNINEVSEDICQQILTCEESGKAYKVIPQEYKFYKEHNIPIPRLSPNERHKERLTKRNLRRMYVRNCTQCKKEIQTTYEPERPEQVYCEECYLSEVY